MKLDDMEIECFLKEKLTTIYQLSNEIDYWNVERRWHKTQHIDELNGNIIEILESIAVNLNIELSDKATDFTYRKDDEE